MPVASIMGSSQCDYLVGPQPCGRGHPLRGARVEWLTSVRLALGDLRARQARRAVLPLLPERQSVVSELFATRDERSGKRPA